VINQSAMLAVVLAHGLGIRRVGSILKTANTFDTYLEKSQGRTFLPSAELGANRFAAS
jgi:hypothetical protein